MKKDTSNYSISTRHPLSGGQEGLWFVQETTPSDTTYNVPIAIYVDELIDDTVIYELTEQILAVHPSLRVHFGMDEKSGNLYQEIQSAKGYLQRDSQYLESHQTLESVFYELTKQPFDLSKEVFRLHIRKDEQLQKTYVLFVAHHIVSDGVSSAIFGHDFVQKLRGHLEGDTFSATEEDTGLSYMHDLGFIAKTISPVLGIVNFIQTTLCSFSK